MTENNDDSFSSSKAEVFEALGHPTRIRILQELASRPLAYSELKRAAGMESNGLLTFHLGKMRDLVRLNPEGNYALTDEGKEALRIVEASRKQPEGHLGQRRALHLTHQRALLAGLLVALIVLGSVAVYQQEQIGSLNHSISSGQAGSVLINGTRYWQLSIPLQSLNLPASIQFNGVAFNLTASPLGGVGTLSMSLVSFNGTIASQQAGIPVTFRIVSFPNIQVRFADGQTESRNFVNTTGFQTFNSTGFQSQGSTISFSLQPTATPWFSHHSSPRAGVYLNSTTDSVELYVGVGS
jgi:DNA-binding transcriptional ArsR family regulator